MRFFLILLLLPFNVFSQDLAGVWTGTIYNDTTRKYIPYEIAITENKGKLSGFSHTIFTGENNRQEVGVKSLKIKKKSGKILIEDDELIFDNYDSPPPKGVRQYSVLNLTAGPSGVYLIGVFNTNQTKEYASLTGTIHLQKKEKITETRLIPKLDELDLSNSLSFIQEKPKENIELAKVVEIKKTAPSQQPIQQKETASVLPNKNKASALVVKIEKDENLIDINEDTIDYKVDVVDPEEVASKKKKQPAKEEPVLLKKPEVVTPPQKVMVKAPETNQPSILQPKKEVVVAPVKEQKKSEPLPIPKGKETTVLASRPVNKPHVTTPPNKKETSVNQNTPVNKPLVITAAKEKPKEQIMEVPKKGQNLPGPIISSADLAKRKIETIRSVDFKSDSIVLTLYDNGVIDGDTVSVILNGKTIMSKQRLTTTAVTKTIYITPDLGDSLQLIMYAENLGTIAPNTGLLIIQDGEDRYQIRFAGDLQKNSAILLRRKRN